MANPTKRLEIPAKTEQRGIPLGSKKQAEPFKVQTPTPARKVQHGIGNSGSNVRMEPIDHLIQHIKQYDARLYEALKRLAKQQTENLDQIVQSVNNPDDTLIDQQDKVTFGLLKTLTVSDGLTLYYVCRKPGKWVDFVAKIKDQMPTGTSAILDVKRSVDDGTHWASIFPTGNANKIVLPASQSTLVVVKKFAIPDMSIGNLLRIDCLQIGSGDPGKGIEVVGRWQSNSPTTP